MSHDDESKKDRVEIKTVKLLLGKREIELKVDQAKKLRQVLNELFGAEVIREVRHEHYPYWYWYPQVYGSTISPTFGASSDSTTALATFGNASFTTGSSTLNLDIGV